MKIKCQPILLSCLSLALSAGLASAQDSQLQAGALLGKGIVAGKEQQRIRDSKIKSMAVWQYFGTPTGVSDKGVEISKVVYDRFGDAVVESKLGQAGSQNVTEEHYDPNGRLLQTLRGAPGSQSKIDYQYNAAGKVQEAVGHTADGKANLDLKYEYDGQGRVSRAVTAMAGRGIMEDSMEYGPDGKAKTLKMVGHFVNGTTSQTLVTYEAAGGKYDQTMLDAKGATVAHTVSSLDSAGNVLDLAQMDGKGTVVSKMHSSYDAQGNLVHQTMSGADGKTILDTANTYDGGGHMIETVATGPAGVARTAYHYDAKGNLTDQTRYDAQGRPVEVLKYVYEFFN